jgi:type IV pilus assembly protein PilW
MGGSGTGSLYMKVNSNNAEQLAAGIEYMRIRYGVDTDDDGSVNKYVDASTLSANPQVQDNFNRVISLDIALLISSLNPVLNAGEIGSGNITYDLHGTPVSRPIDGRLRKVYHGTIHLRNGGVL